MLVFSAFQVSGLFRPETQAVMRMEDFLKMKLMTIFHHCNKTLFASFSNLENYILPYQTGFLLPKLLILLLPTYLFLSFTVHRKELDSVQLFFFTVYYTPKRFSIKDSHRSINWMRMILNDKKYIFGLINLNYNWIHHQVNFKAAAITDLKLSNKTSKKS